MGSIPPSMPPLPPGAISYSKGNSEIKPGEGKFVVILLFIFIIIIWQAVSFFAWSHEVDNFDYHKQMNARYDNLYPEVSGRDEPRSYVEFLGSQFEWIGDKVSRLW